MSPTRKPSAVTGLRKGMGTAAAAAEPAQDAGEATAPLLAPRPEKPIRYTLDLDPGRHRYLMTYAAEIDAKASVIVRELLDEMRNDPDLAARIRARIWQTRQQ